MRITTRSAHQHMGRTTVWFTTNPGWTHGLISSLDKPLPHPFYRQNKKGYNTPGKTTWNGLHRRQTSQADTTLVHTATHHQVDPSFVGGLQYTSRTTSLLETNRQATNTQTTPQTRLTTKLQMHRLTRSTMKNAINLKNLLSTNTHLQEITKNQQNHMIPQDSHVAQTPSTGSQGNKHTNHMARFISIFNGKPTTLPADYDPK